MQLGCAIVVFVTAELITSLSKLLINNTRIKQVCKYNISFKNYCSIIIKVIDLIYPIYSMCLKMPFSAQRIFELPAFFLHVQCACRKDYDDYLFESKKQMIYIIPNLCVHNVC